MTHFVARVEIADWKTDRIYNTGDKVRHQGQVWLAQWWVQGQEPGTTGQWGVWKRVE